jgi:hypothetical protein
MTGESQSETKGDFRVRIGALTRDHVRTTSEMRLTWWAAEHPSCGYL